MRLFAVLAVLWAASASAYPLETPAPKAETIAPVPAIDAPAAPVKLDLPAMTRDQLLARRDELLRTPTPKARIVAISGFAVTAAAVLALAFGQGAAYALRDPGAHYPEQNAQFVAAADANHRNAIIAGIGALGALVGLGGVIALDGADADRDAELERIHHQLDVSDPLADD